MDFAPTLRNGNNDGGPAECPLRPVRRRSQAKEPHTANFGLDTPVRRRAWLPGARLKSWAGALAAGMGIGSGRYFVRISLYLNS